MSNFIGFPKIPRLNREIVITEKIDGTNAQIYIRRLDLGMPVGWSVDHVFANDEFVVHAGSRNRCITVGKDNFGFANWVAEHAQALVNILGEGQHFGEWWGKGIQRTYGLDHKRFSLFNTARWGWLDDPAVPREERGVPEALHVVPKLFQGTFSPSAVNLALTQLAYRGSAAAPGFVDPEGIVVFHSAAKQMFKVTCKDDAQPKTKA